MDPFAARFNIVHRNNTAGNKFANSPGMNMPNVVINLVSEQEIVAATEKLKNEMTSSPVPSRDSSFPEMCKISRVCPIHKTKVAHKIKLQTDFSNGYLPETSIRVRCS